MGRLVSASVLVQLTDEDAGEVSEQQIEATLMTAKGFEALQDLFFDIINSGLEGEYANTFNISDLMLGDET